MNLPLVTESLTPAQEASIKKKVAAAASLDLPTFARRALKSAYFEKWFNRKFVAIPTTEKITEDIRQAFLPAWEKHLRDCDEAVNYQAEQDAQDEADRVQHDRENEDEPEGDDDDDAEAIAADTVVTLVPLDPPPADYDPPPTAPSFTQAEGPELFFKADDPRVPPLRAWRDAFGRLPETFQTGWRRTHAENLVTVTGGNGDDSPWMQVYLELAPAVTIPDTVAKRPEWEKFERITARVRRLLIAHAPQAAEDLDDITATEGVKYVIPGLIPYGLTAFIGDEGACKSLLVQKSALVISDNEGATFDGVEVEHGQVLYATLDANARPEQVKPGMRIIRDKLGQKPSGRLSIVGPSLYLNDPESVENWLDLNAARLPCKMIVVDSLVSALPDGDSLQNDSIMRAVVRGTERLLMECDAVVIAHHNTKGGDPFGSVFFKPMLAAAHNVTRPNKGKHVTVTTVRMKFDQSAEGAKRTYTLDGPLLDAGEVAGKGNTSGGTIKRRDILAALPTTATPIADARKLIEPMLVGKTAASRGEEWRRLRNDWADAGLVVVKGKTIRRA
jgi:hypothetical protein